MSASSGSVAFLGGRLMGCIICDHLAACKVQWKEDARIGAGLLGSAA